ncbi:MAG: phage integrase N-terminal SAM-like domain-containing protein [Cyanobacteria bacterium J06642_2]
MAPGWIPMSKPPKHFLDKLRVAIQLKHRSCRTKHSYVYWIRSFILSHNKQTPLAKVSLARTLRVA